MELLVATACAAVVAAATVVFVSRWHSATVHRADEVELGIEADRVHDWLAADAFTATSWRVDGASLVFDGPAGVARYTSDLRRLVRHGTLANGPGPLTLTTHLEAFEITPRGTVAWLELRLRDDSTGTPERHLSRVGLRPGAAP